MSNTKDTPYQTLLFSLKSLNIIDFEERCQRRLYLTNPKRQKAFWFLKSLTVRNKMLMERNAAECDIISPMFRLLKDLPSIFLLEMNMTCSYMYYKSKLLSFLKYNTIYDEYIALIIRKVSIMSSAEDVEMLLRKYLRVHNLLHTRSELSFHELQHYELVAELIKLSYHTKVQNSQLVVTLLRIAIGMHTSGIFARHVRQPTYPEGFLKYALENSIKEQFDLQFHCIKHPRTLWEFSKKLSVFHAVSVGNVNRITILLKHGIDVFPENEMDKARLRFPFIAAYMPRTYLMTLHMMACIKWVNDFIQKSSQPSLVHSDSNTATRDQIECFRLIWRSIPDPIVKYSELDLAISTEFLDFAVRETENPVPYEKNTALCDLYRTCFKDLAVGAHEPRSLKHLSRCAVRKSLGRSFRLPNGIFNLGLSMSCLESYLNLESD